jgi:hypothetical protein
MDSNSSELQQAWADLQIDAAALLRDRGEGPINKIKGFTATVAGPGTADAISQWASKTLFSCAEHLADKVKPLDREYQDAISSLLDIYPKLLNPSLDEDTEEKARGAIERVTLFQAVHTAGIHTVRHKPQNKKMLGDYLVELGHVTPEQLKAALADQEAGRYPGKRVGDILQHLGIITRAQIDEAIELQMLDNLDG